MKFEYRRSAHLPALAWIARTDGARVVVRCGASVRCEVDGFVEGSWAGGPQVSALAEATTVFGSGIVAHDRGALVVTPSHTLEGIFAVRRDGELIASNSLVGLLVAADLELDRAAAYPTVFGQINQGISRAAIELPTMGPPIRQQYFENLLIGHDLELSVSPKPREQPFSDFEDYRDRLVARTRSVFDNAPGYRPLASISSGYDSTASAAVAAQAGCTSAVTFAQGEPWHGYAGEDDSGERAAISLGMTTSVFDRLAYMALDDAPEAEFLANGMSGEDVFLRSAETALGRTALVNGFWGGAAWRGIDRAELKRTDLSGASLLEFRLRVDMINLPVPYIGGTEQPSISRLRDLPEMRSFHVQRGYDEPVARRLAEEAGVARGTFAVQKLAASVRLHRRGVEAMSESGRRSFDAFAGDALARLPRRERIARRHRLAIRLAHAARVPRLVEDLERRRREGVHFEPVLGSLLLRWAVERLRPRYRDAA